VHIKGMGVRTDSTENPTKKRVTWGKLRFILRRTLTANQSKGKQADREEEARKH